MIDLEDRILIAVPKKGRLKEITLDYLKKIGLSFNQKDRFDISLCSATPLALVFLPAADIPLYLSKGRVSYGITGQDMVAEKGLEDELNEVMPLGYGKCSVCIAAPQNLKVTPQSLENKTIATSFPYLTQKYFNQTLNIQQIIIKIINGSVEIAPTLGTAHAVVDLVETGSTLRAAGLEVIDTLMTSEAVLLAKKNLGFKEQEWLLKIKTRLTGVLTAQQYLLLDYNIPKKALKLAEKITPGFNSPTIMPLEQEEWVAIRSVIQKKEKYEVIEKLKEIGAQAILVSQMDYFQS